MINYLPLPSASSQRLMTPKEALIAAYGPDVFDAQKVQAEMARRWLREFIKAAWHVIEPGVPYKHNWHIDAICDHLQSVCDGGIKRLIINIPPRHAKSTICSVALPCWDWINNPQEQYLFASYAQQLSIRDSLKCRRLIQSPWYQAHFGNAFQLTGDQNQKGRFDNDRNGYRIATSVDAGVTGEGGSKICFPSHQQVMTEVGPVMIGDIVDGRMGLRVWSRDTLTGVVELRPITGWHTNPSSELVRVHMDDGTSFECTPTHRVWTETGWVEAKSLQASDVLPGFSGADLPDCTLGDVELRNHLVKGHVFIECDEHDIIFSKFGAMSRRSAPDSLAHVGGIGLSSNVTMGSSAPYGVYSGSSDAKPFSNISGLLCAVENFKNIITGKLAPIFRWAKLSMYLAVGNVFRSRSICEIGDRVVQRIAVKMADINSGIL